MVDLSPVEIFGSDKINSFAARLNIEESAAAEGLTDVIPQLIDRFMGSGEALAGMMDMAKIFFSLKIKEPFPADGERLFYTEFQILLFKVLPF
jgi:hypothetical protein